MHTCACAHTQVHTTPPGARHNTSRHRSIYFATAPPLVEECIYIYIHVCVCVYVYTYRGKPLYVYICVSAYIYKERNTNLSLIGTRMSLFYT